jgi:Acetyltransferase (GNAT) domain
LPDGSPSPDALARLDGFARQLLAGAGDLRVALARDDGERAAVYALRHRHVTGDAAPGLERDPYDDDALHVCAWDGPELAGTIRIVLPAPGRPLPVESDFDLVVEPRGQVAEAGRLVVAPERRGDPAHRTWGGLYGLAWLSLREHGIAVVAGVASAGMVERLRGLGLPVEELGPARPHWGELRHPVRLDPAGSAPAWFAGAARVRS